MHYLVEIRQGIFQNINKIVHKINDEIKKVYKNFKVPILLLFCF